MLYNDCIEFFANSWTQMHVIECETGFCSPNVNLQGDCDGIPVTCSLWIDEEPLGDSYQNESRGLFKVVGETDSLDTLRSSAKKISMDVHMSADIYGRVVDALNRHRLTERSLAFGAYYLMREKPQTTTERWFDVLRFEVSESVAMR